MSKNVEFKLDRAGVGALLKSSGVRAEIDRVAGERFAALPPGYAMHPGETSQRYKVSIATDSVETMISDRQNNTLLKVVLGGRG